MQNVFNKIIVQWRCKYYEDTDLNQEVNVDKTKFYNKFGRAEWEISVNFQFK